MLEIDGGDGGGQLLRSSLALAAVTDTPVEVSNIRGDRPTPGLKAQHLTAVEVLAAVSDASVEGATLGAETVRFDPGDPTGGHVEADVGTAGSLTLVCHAVLPVATVLDTPLAVTLTGGTAVKWSPPLSTYRRVTLSLCRRHGLQAALERHRTGFYPAGGGEATLYLGPSALSPITLTERGQLQGARVVSRASQSLATSDVAKRQADAAADALEGADIPVLERTQTLADTDSTGSALTIQLVYEQTTAGFDALGEPGKPAEDVAAEAIEETLAFHEGQGAVDRHAADQLLVTLALAGGSLVIPERTDHVETNLAVLRRFGFEIGIDESGPTPVVSAPGRY